MHRTYNGNNRKKNPRRSTQNLTIVKRDSTTKMKTVNLMKNIWKKFIKIR